MLTCLKVVINGFGFNHFDSLALTCPIGGITAISIFLVSYMTRKIRDLRYLLIVVLAAISLAGTAACWLGPKSDRGVMFAGIFLLAVQVAAGGLAVGLASSNISGHTKKATVSATTFVGYCKNSHSIYEMNYSDKSRCRQCHWPRHLRGFSRPSVSCRVHGKLHLSLRCYRNCYHHSSLALDGEQTPRPRDWRSNLCS
jgi:hypothetical protein